MLTSAGCRNQLPKLRRPARSNALRWQINEAQQTSIGSSRHLSTPESLLWEPNPADADLCGLGLLNHHHQGLCEGSMRQSSSAGGNLAPVIVYVFPAPVWP